MRVDGAVHVRPPHPAVPGAALEGCEEGSEARSGALVLLSSHDGVRCSLRRYKRPRLYLTTRGSGPHSSLNPSPTPAQHVLLKQARDVRPANPQPSRCNRSLLQLLAASTRVCHAATGSFSSSASDLCHGPLPEGRRRHQRLSCSWHCFYILTRCNTQAR